MTTTRGVGTVEPTAQPPNAFRVRSFRFLWINNVFYFLVLNAQRFVFGWLVLDGLNRGERDQGLAVFALGIPALFLVLHAGVWADRLDRKRLLIGSQVASLAVMVATALLLEAEMVGFGTVILLSLVAGVASTIGQPVRASLVPALVSREQIFSAIAATALAMTLSMILGPVVAERVGDRFGFAATFWFQAGLLLLGLLALLPMRVPDHEPDSTADGQSSDDRSVKRQTIEALRHIWHDPALKKLFILLTLAGVTVNPAVMVSMQAFIKEDLGRNAGDAAPVLALMGVGIAISSIVVMRKGDMKNKGAAFQRALMVGSSMTFLMGRATSYSMLLPLALVMGLGGGFYINMNQGLIQANTPQRLMGRVMAVYTLIQAGLLPLGALILGLIGSVIGMGLTISAAAAILFVTVIIIYVTDKDLRTLS